MTPIFVPVAAPGALLCACAALPKTQAPAKIANCIVFPTDPDRLSAKILKFTFFSFFQIVQNLSQAKPA
jgi:hypothetical protein